MEADIGLSVAAAQLQAGRAACADALKAIKENPDGTQRPLDPMKLLKLCEAYEALSGQFGHVLDTVVQAAARRCPLDIAGDLVQTAARTAEGAVGHLPRNHPAMLAITEGVMRKTCDDVSNWLDPDVRQAAEDTSGRMVEMYSGRTIRLRAGAKACITGPNAVAPHATSGSLEHEGLPISKWEQMNPKYMCLDHGGDGMYEDLAGVVYALFLSTYTWKHLEVLLDRPSFDSHRFALQFATEWSLAINAVRVEDPSTDDLPKQTAATARLLEKLLPGTPMGFSITTSGLDEGRASVNVTGVMKQQLRSALQYVYQGHPLPEEERSLSRHLTLFAAMWRSIVTGLQVDVEVNGRCTMDDQDMDLIFGSPVDVKDDDFDHFTEPFDTDLVLVKRGMTKEQSRLLTAFLDHWEFKVADSGDVVNMADLSIAQLRALRDDVIGRLKPLGRRLYRVLQLAKRTDEQLYDLIAIELAVGHDTPEPQHVTTGRISQKSSGAHEDDAEAAAASVG